MTRDFKSPLAGEIERFLTHHRALGKRFETEEAALGLLDRYLVEREVPTLEAITSALLTDFLAARPRTRPRSYNHLLNVLQRLFDWLTSQEVIPQSPLRILPQRTTAMRRPFLLEPNQVEQLLAAAAALPDARRTVRRGATYRMAFALMYALGLRVGEVARLRRHEIDFQQRCLVIRQSKFAKSRLLPFGPRLATQLHSHCQEQQARFGLLAPDDPVFSLTRDGRTPLSSHSMSRTFQRLLPTLALTAPAGVAPPRLHCLRHSFAVGTLLGWYRAGIDPNPRLIHLSTFLGHVNPASTAVYLTITAELLGEANQRFARFAASIRQEARP